jgi:membrane fusion protein (multidrug efflux system)
VAVVGSDNTVSFKSVTVGPRVGNLWVIEKGLAPTDRVIVEGLQRVRPGSPVTPKMAAPAASDGAAKATDVAAGEGK